MASTHFTLGIDTGGTYTDAVLVEGHTREVLAGAKALTTYRDLSIGIRNAIAEVMAQLPGSVSHDEIVLVSLSTTLATNAIVEDRGYPVSLILIGYDRDLITRFGFGGELASDDIIFIAGGHDGLGDEQMPLDEQAIVRAVWERMGQVEAFAISGYFSVRNPNHELRCQQLIESVYAQHQSPPPPITCGHELSSRLNAIRRATTTTLNAGLIPLLKELIASVRQTLIEQSILAPLMVVKGDGSLVRADWALGRPIETILSGPAASAIGARVLSGHEDGWVVDMGGTTTDIARLRGGRPRLNAAGARVGRWRTMVEAVDVHTLGLGGDSEIWFEGSPHESGSLRIGPSRITPLSLLAHEYPNVRQMLATQLEEGIESRHHGRFVLTQRQPMRALPARDQAILDRARLQPVAVPDLFEDQIISFVMNRLNRLSRQRLILMAGFTPTDALHCLGRMHTWDVEAARLGAELLAIHVGIDALDLCESVVASTATGVSQALLSSIWTDEGVLLDWGLDGVSRYLLGQALTPTSSDCLVTMQLTKPILGIGAPAATYLPQTARQLHTDLVLPDHADVANAIGAVMGSVIVQRQITINPISKQSEFYRAHLMDGVEDASHLDTLVLRVEEKMAQYLAALAREAGADQVEITMKRIDHIAPVQAGWGGEVYLGTELTFTAIGRPRTAVPSREGS